MNPTSPIPRPGSRFFACLLVPALLPAVAPMVTRGAPPAATAEPKPYTLYMGADLDVQHGKEFLRVQDVVGDSLVATVDGKVRTISTTEGPVSLRVQHSLKLDRTTVTISDLKSERAYSPANDPWRKWANRGTTADTGAAERQFVDAQAARDLNAARASNPNLGRAQAVFAAQQPAMQAAYDSAATNFNQASVDAGGDLYNPGLMAQQTQDELAKKLFDAMEVDFTVSAPEPLADPYVVLLAQYHVPDEPKGTAHNWIYAQALDPINDRPRTVHILKGGFPPGFVLEKMSVHLYARGREVATTVAEKRLELTRDEAFQYTVIDYLARHKDATLPPALVMGRLAADARQHLSAGQLHQTYFVKVTKDGLPEDAFLDTSCLHRVDDPSLRAVIRELRFTPALLKGQPVAAVASLNLNDLPP